MEFYQELTNMSDYYLSYDTFQSEECLDDGCEDEDEDVAMATYILELVLMPVFGAGFVWKNPLRFYPAGLIRINPPAKSQKNPPEGGFF